MKYQTQARFWVTAEFYALETCFEPRVLQLALMKKELRDLKKEKR